MNKPLESEVWQRGTDGLFRPANDATARAAWPVEALSEEQFLKRLRERDADRDRRHITFACDPPDDGRPDNGRPDNGRPGDEHPE